MIKSCWKREKEGAGLGPDRTPEKPNFNPSLVLYFTHPIRSRATLKSGPDPNFAKPNFRGHKTMQEGSQQAARTSVFVVFRCSNNIHNVEFNELYLVPVIFLMLLKFYLLCNHF